MAELIAAYSPPIGGVLCLGILLMRRHVPESPRWLVTHGFARQADATVADIEQRVRADTGRELEPAQGRLEVHPRRTFGFGLIARAMLGKYRSRSILALALMIAQAFLYNAVFFSYALVLVRYHGVASERTGTHLVTRRAADCNRGRLRSRRVLRLGTDFRLDVDLLFCLRRRELRLSHRERRALAIAIFYALGTAVGGTAAPLLFGYLVQSGSAWARAASG